MDALDISVVVMLSAAAACGIFMVSGVRRLVLRVRALILGLGAKDGNKVEAVASLSYPTKVFVSGVSASSSSVGAGTMVELIGVGAVIGGSV